MEAPCFGRQGAPLGSMDVRTLVVAAVVVDVLLIAVLTFIWKTRRAFPGFGCWILQYVAMLEGFLPCPSGITRPILFP